MFLFLIVFDSFYLSFMDKHNLSNLPSNNYSANFSNQLELFLCHVKCKIAGIY